MTLSNLLSGSVPVQWLAAMIGLSVFAGLMIATWLDGLRPGVASAVLVSVVCGGLAWLIGPQSVPLAFAAWTGLMVFWLAALAAIDGATRTVPDALTFSLIVLGLAHAATLPGAFGVFSATSLGIIIVGAVAGRLVGRENAGWLGGGDVLLFAGGAAWLGPMVLVDLLVLSALFLAAQWLARQIARWRTRDDGEPLFSFDLAELPLAPSLGTAQTILWLGGPIL